MIETLRPFGLGHVAMVREDHAMPAAAVEPSAAERHDLEQLLSAMPVAVDEVVRLSGLPSGSVQMVLLELELAGRLERHAGGRVSLVVG